VGQGHGKTATQDPRGLRRLPQPDPRKATSSIPHAVVTGEPDDRETIKSGSAGGRAEKDQPRLTPRRAAHPSAWHNSFNRLQRCHGRSEDVIDAFFDLADAIITVRRLIREAWTFYRWDTRPPHRP
jgi:hypothetical protein